MNESGRTIQLIGDRYRRAREARGLSREGLARASRGEDRLSVPTIKRAEAGHPIYVSSAGALARLLSVDLLELSGQDNRTRAARPATTTLASLAILPFEASDASEESRAFADGLVEDLISRLSSEWFPVIARSSSFSLRGQQLSSAEIGQRLGADYLVEGSVRRSQTTIRVNARLSEATSARQVWADTYDASIDDVLKNQDEVCRKVLSQIGRQVLTNEAERARKQPTVKNDAWQLALRGTWHFHRSTPGDNERSRSLLREALLLDDSIALARYTLVLSHQHDLLNQWTQDPAETRREMRRQSVEFERLFPGNPWMHVAAAYDCVAHGEREQAIHRLQEALHLAPNSVPAHSLYGQALAMGSRPEEGLHELELAMTLSPFDSGMWTMLLTTALAHFAAGRYEACVEWASKAIRNRPQVPMNYAALAAAYSLMGDVSKGRASLAQLEQRQGSMSLRGFQSVLGITDVEIATRFLDGLRLAGLPDG